MSKLAGWALIAMAALHAIVFGMEAMPYLGHWTSGGLWSTEHLQPFGDQSRELLPSNAVFWATLGSAAGPLAILGLLILWLVRRGLAVPPFVGWCLIVWALAASLVMQPSGFPLALLIGGALVMSGRAEAPGSKRAGGNGGPSGK